MLNDRLAISVFLIPAALWVVALGGWPYLLGVMALFGVAALEYAQMMRHGGWRPALPLLAIGAPWVAAISGASLEWPARLALTAAALAALVWHLVDYERGAAKAGIDFTVTLAGLYYLGWLGGLFVALRARPDGLWWVLVTLSSTWMADTGAYLFGRRFGRRQLAPRLSPKKTWEGYLGGAGCAALTGLLLSGVVRFSAGPGGPAEWPIGLLLGLLVGLLSPLGDLGISMLKRQAGVKDSGALLGSHGGALDRIDSWLVAIAVGYALASLLGK